MGHKVYTKESRKWVFEQVRNDIGAYDINNWHTTAPYGTEYTAKEWHDYFQNDLWPRYIKRWPNLPKPSREAGLQRLVGSAVYKGDKRMLTTKERKIFEANTQVAYEAGLLSKSDVVKLRQIRYHGQGTSKMLDKKVEEFGREVFGNSVFMDQAKKFGKAIVKKDMKVLTVGEFGLRYGLEIA